MFDYEEKLLWARFDELAVIDELLTLIEKSGDCVSSRVIPPKHLRQDLLRTYHEGIGGGHLGFEKTYLKLKERFYWPKMKEDTKLMCYNCMRCGARKCTNHALRAALVPMAAGFPFERIAMDIVGPLPKTLRNNRYLLVIIDYYTRWPEAFALEHQDAHSVAIKLISDVIARYGAPYIIHTDQGTNFESKLVSELCKLYDIKKTRTTPYHPQSDGLVERLNRTLIDTIALIAQDAQETWDLRIGPALMAIRTSVQSTTGFLPHFLLFGREMRLPADLFYDVPQESLKTATESVANLKQVLSKVHETVSASMESNQRRQKDCYDRRTYGCRFKPGDFVWMINKKPELLVNKFHDRWLGPFEVIKRCSDLVYEILNKDTGKVKRVHYNLLKAASMNTNALKKQQPDDAAVSENDSDDDLLELPTELLAAQPNQDFLPMNNAMPTTSSAANVPAATRETIATTPAMTLPTSTSPARAIAVAPTAPTDLPSVVEPTAQRGGIARYDLRSRPKKATRDTMFVILAIIILAPLVTADDAFAPLVGVARNGQATVNNWVSIGQVLTWASLIIPLSLATITLINLLVKCIRKLTRKCSKVSLQSPSKVVNSEGRIYDVCGCGRIDSKDPHLLIKPPLKDNQIVSEVRPSQRHVHSDGITIICLHPKCRMLPAMTFSLITIACLLTPVTSEILVPRMQVQAERSSWNAVRLRAEAPRNARTDHELWLEGRIGRIADIKVAPARNCYEHDDKTFIPPISTLLETSMEIYCLDQTTVTVAWYSISRHSHALPSTTSYSMHSTAW